MCAYSDGLPDQIMAFIHAHPIISVFLAAQLLILRGTWNSFRGRW